MPGNNELRLKKKGEKYSNSLDKFHGVLELCRKLGVHVTPQKIGGVWIVPLFSWYTPHFDKNWNQDMKYQVGGKNVRVSIIIPTGTMAGLLQVQMARFDDGYVCRKSVSDRSSFSIT